MQEMYFEARGQYDDAERVTTEQLEEAPESQMLLKRQVALEKSKGNIAAAMELLRKYVDVFQTDREAWEELGELYLQACLTSKTLHTSCNCMYAKISGAPEILDSKHYVWHAFSKVGELRPMCCLIALSGL